MPGPMSDSYDPEFGTGERADAVRQAIAHVRETVTVAIGSGQLADIVLVAEAVNSQRDRQRRRRTSRRVYLTEAELRVIRFCVDRATESI